MVLNSQQKRIEWIDIAKGICIITIVAIHISSSFWNTTIGIYCSKLGNMYEVTVFFCIAGLTLKEERLSNPTHFIKRKIKTLYVKTIAIGVIAVFLHNALIRIGFYKIGTYYYGKLMYKYSARDCIKQLIFTSCLANREVIIGPMWYADVLFMALVLLAAIQFFLMHICNNKSKIPFYRFVTCLLLLMTSTLFSVIFNFTIPRFNNTLVAIFLIDCSQLLSSHFRTSFDNKRIFTVALIVMLNLPLYGTVIMNSNSLRDPAFLILSSMSSMYSIFYISKKIGGVCFAGYFL